MRSLSAPHFLSLSIFFNLQWPFFRHIAEPHAPTVLCVNVCVQPITCDGTGIIPSGSVGLQLPCVVFSLIHPFRLAFLTLAWPCRPVCFPGHWESSQYPLWAGVYLFFCCELQNRGLIQLLSIYGKFEACLVPWKKHKTTNGFYHKGPAGLFSGWNQMSINQWRLMGVLKNPKWISVSLSFSFPIPVKWICFNMT